MTSILNTVTPIPTNLYPPHLDKFQPHNFSIHPLSNLIFTSLQFPTELFTTLLTSLSTRLDNDHVAARSVLLDLLHDYPVKVVSIGRSRKYVVSGHSTLLLLILTLIHRPKLLIQYYLQFLPSLNSTTFVEAQVRQFYEALSAPTSSTQPQPSTLFDILPRIYALLDILPIPCITFYTDTISLINSATSNHLLSNHHCQIHPHHAATPRMIEGFQYQPISIQSPVNPISYSSFFSSFLNLDGQNTPHLAHQLTANDSFQFLATIPHPLFSLYSRPHLPCIPFSIHFFNPSQIDLKSTHAGLVTCFQQQLSILPPSTHFTLTPLTPSRQSLHQAIFNILPTIASRPAAPNAPSTSSSTRSAQELSHKSRLDPYQWLRLTGFIPIANGISVLTSTKPPSSLPLETAQIISPNDSQHDFLHPHPPTQTGDSQLSTDQSVYHTTLDRLQITASASHFASLHSHEPPHGDTCDRLQAYFHSRTPSIPSLTNTLTSVLAQYTFNQSHVFTELHEIHSIKARLAQNQHRKSTSKKQPPLSSLDFISTQLYPSLLSSPLNHRGKSESGSDRSDSDDEDNSAHKLEIERQYIAPDILGQVYSRFVNFDSGCTWRDIIVNSGEENQHHDNEQHTLPTFVISKSHRSSLNSMTTLLIYQYNSNPLRTSHRRTYQSSIFAQSDHDQLVLPPSTLEDLLSIDERDVVQISHGFTVYLLQFDLFIRQLCKFGRFDLPFCPHSFKMLQTLSQTYLFSQWFNYNSYNDLQDKLYLDHVNALSSFSKPSPTILEFTDRNVFQQLITTFNSTLQSTTILPTHLKAPVDIDQWFPNRLEYGITDVSILTQLAKFAKSNTTPQTIHPSTSSQQITSLTLQTHTNNSPSHLSLPSITSPAVALLTESETTSTLPPTHSLHSILTTANNAEEETTVVHPPQLLPSIQHPIYNNAAALQTKHPSPFNPAHTRSDLLESLQTPRPDQHHAPIHHTTSNHANPHHLLDSKNISSYSHHDAGFSNETSPHADTTASSNRTTFQTAILAPNVLHPTSFLPYPQHNALQDVEIVVQLQPQTLQTKSSHYQTPTEFDITPIPLKTPPPTFVYESFLKLKPCQPCASYDVVRDKVTEYLEYMSLFGCSWFLNHLFTHPIPCVLNKDNGLYYIVDHHHILTGLTAMFTTMYCKLRGTGKLFPAQNGSSSPPSSTLLTEMLINKEDLYHYCINKLRDEGVPISPANINTAFDSFDWVSHFQHLDIFSPSQVIFPIDLYELICQHISVSLHQLSFRDQPYVCEDVNLVCTHEINAMIAFYSSTGQIDEELPQTRKQRPTPQLLSDHTHSALTPRIDKLLSELKQPTQHQSSTSDSLTTLLPSLSSTPLEHQHHCQPILSFTYPTRATRTQNLLEMFSNPLHIYALKNVRVAVIFEYSTESYLDSMSAFDRHAILLMIKNAFAHTSTLAANSKLQALFLRTMLFWTFMDSNDYCYLESTSSTPSSVTGGGNSGSNQPTKQLIPFSALPSNINHIKNYRYRALSWYVRHPRNTSHIAKLLQTAFYNHDIQYLQGFFKCKVAFLEFIWAYQLADSEKTPLFGDADPSVFGSLLQHVKPFLNEDPATSLINAHTATRQLAPNSVEDLFTFVQDNSSLNKSLFGLVQCLEHLVEHYNMLKSNPPQSTKHTSTTFPQPIPKSAFSNPEFFKHLIVLVGPIYRLPHNAHLPGYIFLLNNTMTYPLHHSFYSQQSTTNALTPHTHYSSLTNHIPLLPINEHDFTAITPQVVQFLSIPYSFKKGPPQKFFDLPPSPTNGNTMNDEIARNHISLKELLHSIDLGHESIIDRLYQPSSITLESGTRIDNYLPRDIQHFAIYLHSRFSDYYDVLQHHSNTSMTDATSSNNTNLSTLLLTQVTSYISAFVTSLDTTLQSIIKYYSLSPHCSSINTSRGQKREILTLFPNQPISPLPSPYPSFTLPSSSHKLSLKQTISQMLASGTPHSHSSESNSNTAHTQHHKVNYTPVAFSKHENPTEFYLHNAVEISLHTQPAVTNKRIIRKQLVLFYAEYLFQLTTRNLVQVLGNIIGLYQLILDRQ